MKSEVLLSLLFFLSQISFANGHSLQNIKEAEDKEKFYAVLEKTAYIPYFDVSKDENAKYAIKNTSRIMKLPLSIFGERLGVKENEIFFVANFSQDKTYQYKIKDYVFVVYFDMHEGSEDSNSNLILTDDPKEHEIISRFLTKRERIDGFSYRGTERNMKEFKIEWIPVTDIPKPNPLYETNVFKPLEPPILKKAKIYSFEVFIYPLELHEEKRYNVIFKDEENTFRGISGHSNLLDPGRRSMKIYNIFEGTKIIRAFDDNAGNASYPMIEYLILCSTNSLRQVGFRSFIR